MNAFLYLTNDKGVKTFCLILALLSGLLGTAFSLLIRLELPGPGFQYIVDNQLYSSIISTHAIFMILFMVIPALIGGFGSFIYNLVRLDYLTCNEIHPLFFFIEVIIVIGPIYYYIRYPINNYIYSMEGLNIISILIIQIYFNIILGVANYFIFKSMRLYLFPPIIPIINYIVVYIALVMAPLISDFMVLTSHNDLVIRIYKRPVRWIKEGERFLKVSRKCARQSRILNTIAPLMDRSGNGGLYDSFTESARSLQSKAERYENNAAFLWVMAHDILDSKMIMPIGSDSLMELTNYPENHANVRWPRIPRILR